MTSDPEHVSDEEITTVRGQEPAGDTGDATDQADARDATDQAGIVAPSGASDTGAMMDIADSGTLDISDVPAASGASDTGAMMDSRDTGTLDRTDVGETEEPDADDADR
jgi:hypothetical protein